jgi:hypothetical protein
MRQGYFGMYKRKWYCRWCGKQTGSTKSERDGFCNNGGKCKQAWWRAFHKWLKNVTPARDRKTAAGGKSNARKSKKKAR